MSGKGDTRRPTAIPKNESDLRDRLWREPDEAKKAQMLSELQTMVNDRVNR